MLFKIYLTKVELEAPFDDSSKNTLNHLSGILSYLSNILTKYHINVNRYQNNEK